MRRRSGVTLIEVLVAIFVMGVGMLALLTLFPLGALRMSDAIRDDRTATCGYDAAAIANIKGFRQDSTFDFNNRGLVNAALPPNDPAGPSYPVLVDPAGLYSSIAPFDVTSAPLKVIKRASPSFVPAAPPAARTQAILRWFTLLDDITFDEQGVLTGAFERDSRYAWAYLLTRPKAFDPAYVDCQVIVYKNRPLSLNSNLTMPEYHFPAQFDTTRNAIILDVSTGAPTMRVGDWVLDATFVPTTVGAQNYGTSHAQFYRITGLNEAGTLMELDVDPPITGFPANQVSNGTIYFFEGVVQVFPKGLGRMP